MSVPRFLLDTYSSKGIISFNTHKAKKGILRGRNITYTAYQLFNGTEKRQSSFIRKPGLLFIHFANIFGMDTRCACLDNQFTFHALLVKMNKCPGHEHQLV